MRALKRSEASTPESSPPWGGQRDEGVGRETAANDAVEEAPNEDPSEAVEQGTATHEAAGDEENAVALEVVALEQVKRYRVHLRCPEGQLVREESVR